MKILMIGDYSNLHACLAREFKQRGHEVTLVSDGGGYMKTESDIELKRTPGIWGSFKYVYKLLSLLPSLKGYDVVQLINPYIFSLKPNKLRIVYDILKKNNKSVFLSLCGDDHFFVKDCVDTEIFRFSEFRVGKEKTDYAKSSPEREQTYLNPQLAKYTSYLYDTVDGAMSILPEYDMSARHHMNPDKILFTNLPIQLDTVPFSKLDFNKPIKILVGIKGNKEILKGTAKMLEICKEIETEMPGKCEVRMVKNLSLADYLSELSDSHIVIDQLYSYSPATNALQAMALGKVTASGGQPEFYEYIGETEQPIFCLSPLEDDETIKSRLKELILDPERIRNMSEQGRRLVEKHNDVRKIATLFEQHWGKHIKA
ncbi:MAG: hypothetical protein K2I08_11195 [Muribaculaceae bacterium]|nr:hypothetical protein [Muribaculaceae bacterium]MDE6521462.1 hypothetical protein [Muribaculaceae bacterium]